MWTGSLDKVLIVRDGYLDFAEYKSIAHYYAHPHNQVVRTLLHQTGGHDDAFCQLENGKIMKQVKEREYQYYCDLKPKWSLFEPYMAKFYGTRRSRGKSINNETIDFRIHYSPRFVSSAKETLCDGR